MPYPPIVKQTAAIRTWPQLSVEIVEIMRWPIFGGFIGRDMAIGKRFTGGRVSHVEVVPCSAMDEYVATLVAKKTRAKWNCLFVIVAPIEAHRDRA